MLPSLRVSLRLIGCNTLSRQAVPQTLTVPGHRIERWLFAVYAKTLQIRSSILGKASNSSLPSTTYLNSTAQQYYDFTGIIYTSIIGRNPDQSSEEVRAANCTLQMCFRLFTAQQKDGIFTETEHGDPLIFVHNSYGNFNQTTPQGQLTVSSTALDVLRLYLTSFFNVALSGPASYGGPTTFVGNGKSTDQGALLRQALFSSDLSISALMANVADSLTRSFRSSTQPRQNVQAAGKRLAYPSNGRGSYFPQLSN